MKREGFDGPLADPSDREGWHDAGEIRQTTGLSPDIEAAETTRLAARANDLLAEQARHVRCEMDRMMWESPASERP